MLGGEVIIREHQRCEECKDGIPIDINVYGKIPGRFPKNPFWFKLMGDFNILFEADGLFVGGWVDFAD
jgi:hypothetical protein